MKKFNPEAAKRGDRVMTKDGRIATFMGEDDNFYYPLKFRIGGLGKSSCDKSYTEDGRKHWGKYSKLDLFMDY